MTIKLYDLSGGDGRRFSPYCWRAKMAMAHKGLEFETAPTFFTEIPQIPGGGQVSVPVIEDSGQRIRDSFDIALYLEDKYSDRPSLFRGEGGKAFARFIEAWSFRTLHPQIVQLIVADIHGCLADVDQRYFRESREDMLGAPLEKAQQGRDDRLPAFHASLAPLRTMLEKQPFIGGDAPLYADYIVFGTLQWPRTAASYRLLPGEDDPVNQWFKRVLQTQPEIADVPVAA